MGSGGFGFGGQQTRRHRFGFGIGIGIGIGTQFQGLRIASRRWLQTTLELAHTKLLQANAQTVLGMFCLGQSGICLHLHLASLDRNFMWTRLEYGFRIGIGFGSGIGIGSGSGSGSGIGIGIGIGVASLGRVLATK